MKESVISTVCKVTGTFVGAVVLYIHTFKMEENAKFFVEVTEDGNSDFSHFSS